MSWKRISKNVRSDYGKRYRTDAFEIADVGCLIQTTVERVEPGGTSVGISSVFVAGINVKSVLTYSKSIIFNFFKYLQMVV